MQKELKIVNKLMLLFLMICYNTSHTQQHIDAAYFTEKIIKNTVKDGDTLYELNLKTITYKPSLEKYYKFRTEGKPLQVAVTGIDSITDTILIDSILLKKDIERWRKKYKVIDSLFTEGDIREIIDSETNFLEWNKSNPIFKKEKSHIKWCVLNCENTLSRPFYSQKKNYALVVNVKKNSFPTYYVFKKEDEDWVIIDIIENFGL